MAKDRSFGLYEPPVEHEEFITSRGNRLFRGSDGEWYRDPDYLPPQPEPFVAPQAAAREAIDDGVQFADFGKSIMAGGANVAQGLGWLMKVAPLGDYGDNIGGAVEEMGRSAVDYWNDMLSPAAKQELSKEFVRKNDQGEYEWGDASLATVGLYGAQALLGTAAGAGLGAGLTKVLQTFANPVGRSVLMKAATVDRIAGIAPELSQAMKKLRLVDQMIGAAGFGLGEGAIEGMSTGANVYESVMKMDPEKLAGNERYQQIFHSTDEKMPFLERHQYAADTVAKEASSMAGLQSGLTGALLGAPMGAFFGGLLGKNAMTKLAGTRARAAVVGVLGEAAQESLQSGASQVVQNKAMQGAGEDVGTFDDVLNSMLGGAAAGGLIGGAFGAGAYEKPSKPGEKQEVKPTPAADTGAPQPVSPADLLKQSSIDARAAGVPEEEVLGMVREVVEGKKQVLPTLTRLRTRAVEAKNVPRWNKAAADGEKTNETQDGGSAAASPLPRDDGAGDPGVQASAQDAGRAAEVATPAKVERLAAAILGSSRTARGTLDVSASPDKAKQFNGITAKKAQVATKRNAYVAAEFLSNTPPASITTGPQAMELVDKVAATLTADMVKPAQLQRAHNSDKYAYTKAERLPEARAQLGEELVHRLKNNDPVETAAWLMWRVNMSDHLYSDAAGRTAQAMGSWVLTNAGLNPITQDLKPLASAVGKKMTPADPARPETYYGAPYQEWVEGIRRVAAGQPAMPEQKTSYSRSGQQAEPEFQRWFDTSKVVDQDGAPQVVYHGTAAGEDFKEFKYSSKSGMNGPLGIWFASDPAALETFTESRKTDGKPRVMPVYLSVKNPAEFQNYMDFVKATRAFGKASPEDNVRALRRSLMRNGYDGVVIRKSDTDGGVVRDDWVAFKPEQIKSAVGNRGTFDSSKNILFSRGGPYDGNNAADQGTSRPPGADLPNPAAGQVRKPGRVRGSAGAPETPVGPVAARQPLRELPAQQSVAGRGTVTFGPHEPAHQAAERYAARAGIDYRPSRRYAKVNPAFAARVAAAYDAMPHAPNDPEVRASYEAMIRETVAQYQAIKETGLKIEAIEAGMIDPYAATPRLAILDVVENNHLWFFPTDQGFGGPNATLDVSGNPLLAPTDEYIGDRRLLANDVFRIVHDYFGHIKDGVGFRADGEENAWRSHVTMYSPLARGAMTTETRGQNSWLNFGPYGAKNRTASAAETEYAPQKTGLLPREFWEVESSAPLYSRSGAARIEPITVLADNDPLLTPTIDKPGRALIRGRIKAAVLSTGRTVEGRAPVAYVMAGGPASGKTNMVGFMRAHGRLPETSAGLVHIDPDMIKSGSSPEDQRSGMPAFKGIPEYEKILRIQDANGHTDWRAGSVVHEESSLIAKDALKDAIAMRSDVLVDKSLGGGSTEKTLKSLKDAGYEVRMIGVTVPVEMAIERAIARYETTHRYVPIDTLVRLHVGFSQNFDMASQVSDYFELYDTRQGSPTLIAGRFEREIVVENQGLYNEFREKASFSYAKYQARSEVGPGQRAQPGQPAQGRSGSDQPGGRGYGAASGAGRSLRSGQALDFVSETARLHAAEELRLLEEDDAWEAYYESLANSTPQQRVMALERVAATLRGTLFSRNEAQRLNAQEMLNSMDEDAAWDSFYESIINSSPEEQRAALAKVESALGAERAKLSRGARGSTRLASEVRAALAPALKEIAGLADVRIVQSTTDIPGAAVPSDVEGAFVDSRTVYLVADNLPPGREQEVFVHEVFGHMAMERHPEFLRALNMVQTMRGMKNRVITDLWNEVGRRQGALPRIDHAKEVIALMAERGVEHSVLDRLIAAVKAFLRKMGITTDYSPAELRDLIVRAARAFKDQPRNSPQLGALTPASTDDAILAAINATYGDGPYIDRAVLRSRAQESTPAFRKWFEGSVVVDKNGKPLVVYHGTDKDFSEFRTRSQWGEDNEGGSFFTTKPRIANQYARRPGGSVMPVYLNIKNPYRTTMQKWLEGEGWSPEMVREDGEHDGYVIERPESKGGNVYITFEPEQIKSAVGNRGTFDPGTGNILLSRAAKPDPKVEKIMDRILSPAPESLSLKDKMRAVWQKIADTDGVDVRQGMIDSFASIEELEKGFTGGKLLDAAESAYKAALATKNLPSVMAAVMRVGVPDHVNGAYTPVKGRKGILDIFAPLWSHPDGNLLRLWEFYAVARRSDRLIQETNKDGTSREKLLSPADIAEGLALEQKYPEFRQVFDDWQTFNRQMLDLAQDAGVLDPVARKSWEHNDYVPFYRAMEEIGRKEGPRGKRGLSGQKADIRKLEGSDVQIGNVFENMMMNTAHLLDASFKNRAMEKIIGLGIGGAFVPVPLDVEGIKFSDEQLARALQAAGLVVGNQANGMISAMTQAQKDHWSTLFRRIAPRGANIVSVFENGKPKYYEVTDPLLLRAVTGLGYDTFQDVFGLFRGSKKLLTSAITADPAFMMANWIRDTLSNWVISDASMHPFVSAVKGLKATWAEDETLMQLMMAGAGGGGYYDSNPDEIRKLVATKVKDASQVGGFMKSIVSPRNIWQVWRKIGASTENANRVATFKAVLENGGTVAEAAYQARDVLNFSMRGDYAAMRWLTESVPFMNARIQGLYRLYRGARDNPQAFTVKGLMILAATMALALRNNDREEYEELPEWDKDTYWHLFVGGEHFRIPKPFEVGAMFATVPERMWRTLSDRDSGKILWQRLFQMTADTFAMNPIPQLVKPIIEQYANRSMFTGSPIVGMAEQNLQPEAQFTPWTSEFMREMADGMPDWAPAWLRSPRRLEAALRAYTGSVGMYILDVSDAATRQAFGYPDVPNRKIYDMPVVARFWKDPSPRHTKYADQMYEMLDEANAVYSTINRYRREGRLEEAKELLTENRTKLAVRARLNNIATQVRNVNNQIRITQLSRVLTGEEKRKRIDVLNDRKNHLTAQVAPYTDLF